MPELTPTREEIRQDVIRSGLARGLSREVVEVVTDAFLAELDAGTIRFSHVDTTGGFVYAGRHEDRMEGNRRNM